MVSVNTCFFLACWGCVYRVYRLCSLSPGSDILAGGQAVQAHMRTHARTQHTVNGLIMESRTLQSHKPKGSALAKSGCTEERGCSLGSDYRRINDSRATVMLSPTITLEIV